MRPRPASATHTDAVSRRLELLTAELDAARPPTPDLHTRIRPAAAGSSDLVAKDQPPPLREATIPLPGRHAARRAVPGLPPTLVGRVAVSPAHLAVIAVLAVLGLALTTWWVLRSEPTLLTAGQMAQPALTTPVPLSGASPSVAATEVVVDVAGKVRRPGIAVLDPGSRVIDAIKAAGGARKGVDLSSLNLARVLVDGEQIVIGLPMPTGVAASAVSSPGADGGPLVNINTASENELEELPGVGPVTAAAIVAFRAEHGPFTSVDDLMDVTGIGEATLAQIAPHATL